MKDRDKPPKGPLDLKLIPGGLIDLEFLAQWALLTGRADSDLVGSPTVSVLSAADLAAVDADGAPVDLPGAMRTYTSVIQILRLGPTGVERIEHLPPGLADRLTRALGLEEPGEVAPLLARTAARVRHAFNTLLPVSGEDETAPADAAAAAQGG